MIPTYSLVEQRLATLERDAFQDAVVRLLARNVFDFQSIPTKPQGDGGLDGLSANQSHAYCCLGLTQESIRTKSDGQLKAEVCDKFQGDLRKLLEVKADKNNKRKLEKYQNSELETIHTQNNKIRCIYLVCNWFESHRVVGTMNEALDRYKKASAMRFVHDDCRLVIEGPKQFVAKMTVDDEYMLSLEMPRLAALIDSTPKGRSKVGDTSALEEKFDQLREQFPDREDELSNEERRVLHNWIRYLEIMQRLDAEMPDVHQRLARLILDATSDATLHSLSARPSDAGKLILDLSRIIQDQIQDELSAEFPRGKARRLSQFIVARLIGECPLDWRE